MPDRITSAGDGADSVANTPETRILSEVALFRGLPAEQLSKIEARMRRRTFPAGAHVITAEDPGETVYVVLESSVKVYVRRPDSTEVVLAALGRRRVDRRDESCRQLGTLGQRDNVGRDEFPADGSRNLSGKRGGAADDGAQRRKRALEEAASGKRALAIGGGDGCLGRVAAQLSALAQEYGVPSSRNGTLIPLPLTQSDLAALVGASRARVNQAIAFFKKRRYLSVGTDRRITVHDADALARRAR